MSIYRKRLPVFVFFYNINVQMRRDAQPCVSAEKFKPKAKGGGQHETDEKNHKDSGAYF